MESTMKKTLAMLLAIVMMLGIFSGCGSNTEAPKEEVPTESTAEPEQEAVAYVDPYAELEEDYDALSAALYDDILGEFYTLYEEAKAAENVSVRQATMAQAEAKLLESGVMLPLTANGGNYSISRVCPNSWPSVLWGNDSYRFFSMIVTTDLINVTDRDHLKNLWADLKGTGTWEQEAIAYLEAQGYTLKDTYNMYYNGDPKTWDAVATSLSADSEALVNVYDGLVLYDSENVLQPALAESWEISDDGLTYTFHLREGAKWVDSQGRDIAPVKADDFVAGMQHMMDAAGGLEYLVQGVIANATQYINGEITDFSQVGVFAPDDRTVVYSLEAPTSFFMTMLSYGVFAPISREYYESQGGKFGGDFDNSAADYTYGKTPDNIAYCGPYLVSNATPENTIVFKANPSYWNADAVRIQTLTWLFDDQKDATRNYNDTMADTLDMCILNASSVEAAQNDGAFDDYAFIAPTDATSFCCYTNVNRHAFSNVNDGSAESAKTEEQRLHGTAALRNEHFRRALAFSVDRATYNAQRVGDSLRYNSLRNTYTPGTFIAMEEDTTISINGTDTTFPAGTFYGEIMQAQIDADGVELTVWDPEADGGIGSSDGFDGWYNPEAAKAEMALAVEELAAQGIVITKENPIYIDMPYFSGSELFSNRVNSYKQSVEGALDGLVILNLQDCSTQDQWYYCGYYISYGAEANYDLYDVSGWMPDYGDPQSYLDTFLPDYAGIMAMSIGLF